MKVKIIKQIIQNSPEKFHDSVSSKDTNFVLHLSNEVKCVNLTTISEFQKNHLFPNSRNQRSQHLDQMAVFILDATNLILEMKKLYVFLITIYMTQELQNYHKLPYKHC